VRARAALVAAAVALAAATLPLMTPENARADYDVYACSNDGNGPDHIFQSFTNGGWTRGFCLPGWGEQTKVFGYTGLYQGGFLQFAAPPGASLVGYSLNLRGVWEGSNYAWSVDGGPWSNYAAGDGGSLASSYHTDGWWIGVGRGVNWAGFRLATYCGASWCPGNFALTDWKNIRVTIRDNSGGPRLYGEGGLWGEGGWVRGSRPVSYSSSDNVGVRTQRVEIDPGGEHGFGWPISEEKSCDFTYLVPCPGETTTSGSVDTTQVVDGSHNLRYAAMDSSGNWSSEDRTIYVDNHAPQAPALVSADNGGRATQGGFTINWANPDAQAAPIATLRYEVCRAASGDSCRTGSTPVAHGGSGERNSVTSSFGLSEPGAYSMSLWLEDAAGNADRAGAASVALTYGEDKPAAPELEAPPHGWIRSPSYVQRIGYPPAAAVPASGVAGYAVTTDGSNPAGGANAPGRDASYAFPPVEGVTVIKARTVSGAGTLSDTAQVTLKVDRTPPSTSVFGAGTNGVASGGPVDVTLVGTDQPGLSGMGGADLGDAMESGGHVDYSVDGGTTVQVRGDEASMHLAEVGSHTISFRAYDAAGNGSAPRTLTVLVGAVVPPGSRGHSGFWDRTTANATFAAAPSFSTSCPGRTTLTPNARAWIDEADASANHGAAGTLAVRGGDGRRARALLSFDLPAAAACSVASAQLRLNQLSGDAGRALSAYRLGSAWSEASVTWADRPGAAGLPAAAVSPGAGWLTFDVTSQVRAIYRSGNNGFVIQGDGTEVFDGGPQLVVDFG
jgi:hypothetical protein